MTTADDAGRPAVAPVTREVPTTTTKRKTKKERRRRRRWPIVLAVVLLVLLVLAAIAFVVLDRMLRDRTEAQIEQQVGSNLPAEVQGRFTASVDGMWVTPQILKGEFAHVTVVSHGLRIKDAPAKATVQLYALPVRDGKVGEATVDVKVGQAAFQDIPALEQVHGSDPVFGDGTVSTTITQEVLTIPVKIKVVLKPTLAAQTVLLDPVDATITAGPASVPATAIVDQLLPKGLSICAASALPKDVRLESVRTEPGWLVARLTAFQVDLDTLDTAERGSCA